MRRLVPLLLFATVAAATAAADELTDCAQDHIATLKIAGCTKLIAANPGLAVAYSNRADGLIALGQTQLAIADYSRAVTLDPKLAAALYNRGLVYLSSGDAELALADFDQVIRLSGSDATAYNGRGMASVAVGKLDAAAADFAKAIELDPNYARAYLSRATLNLRLGRYMAASNDFEAVLRLHPGDHDGLLGRALAAGGSQVLEATGSANVMDSAETQIDPDAGPAKRHSGQRHRIAAHMQPVAGALAACERAGLQIVLSH